MGIRTVTMLIVVLFSLAACGSGAKVASVRVSSAKVDSAKAGGAKVTSGGQTSPGRSPDPDDRMVKFTECLRQNGMKIADPAPGQPLRITGGPGGSDLVTQKAMKACQYLMQSGPAPANPSTDPKALDAMLKYAECMRANGVDMPDPKPGQAQLPGKSPAGSQAKIKAAAVACHKYLPGLIEATAGPQGGALGASAGSAA